jgi:hypothetical protein
LTIRDLQVWALKFVQQYKRALNELNAAYQGVMAKHPDFNFDADRLQFVPKA